MHLTTEGGRVVKIRMRVPDNWHAHFRQAAMMVLMVRLLHENGWRGRVLGMPNTEPARLLAALVAEYEKEIWAEIRKVCREGEFRPVMTMQITEATTPEMVEAALAAGFFLFKVYPKDVTTNSKNGVVDYRKILPALRALEGRAVTDPDGNVHPATALFHGEDPDHDSQGLLKEKDFIEKILPMIMKECPRLRITLEHISTQEAVKFISDENQADLSAGREFRLASTIAVQYLFCTVDDVIGYSERSGYKVCPHEACKPVYKMSPDREALIGAATSGLPWFFCGNDDAPHPKHSKECAHCACGTANTIASIPTLIEIFDVAGHLDKLEDFLSKFGALWYGFDLNRGWIEVIREDWEIPKEVSVPGLVPEDVIVPWRAGETVHWKVLPAAA